jgi:hypothetical protein
MASEWNGATPNRSLIRVVPHNKNAQGKVIAGDYFCSQTTGMDHVILSAAFEKRLVNDKALKMLLVSYQFKGSGFQIGKKHSSTVDHCGRFVRLP